MAEEVPLEYPITITDSDGKKIKTNTITLGRIKAKHLKTLPDSLFLGEEEAQRMRPDEMIPLIAGLADIPIESAEEIDMIDLMKIGGEILPRFLEELNLSTETTVLK